MLLLTPSILSLLLLPLLELLHRRELALVHAPSVVILVKLVNLVPIGLVLLLVAGILQRPGRTRMQLLRLMVVGLSSHRGLVETTVCRQAPAASPIELHRLLRPLIILWALGWRVPLEASVRVISWLHLPLRMRLLQLLLPRTEPDLVLCHSSHHPRRHSLRLGVVPVPLVGRGVVIARSEEGLRLLLLLLLLPVPTGRARRAGGVPGYRLLRVILLVLLLELLLLLLPLQRRRGRY